MRCICGKKCCGADLVGNAPECIVVYKGLEVPYKFKKGLGFVDSVLIGLLHGSIKNPLFVVHQCPSCDCFVVYVDYKDSDGRHNTKIMQMRSC